MKETITEQQAETLALAVVEQLSGLTVQEFNEVLDWAKGIVNQTTVICNTATLKKAG